jgi:deoxyguanosine kinase
LETNYRYIAIEGNIGAGKTTLSQLLAKRLNAHYMPEHFEDNPFLRPFYENRERFGFTLELSFLEERFRQVKEAVGHENRIVSDYLWEKSLVFARINLSGEELRLFERIYQVMGGQLRVPDLVIYLHRPVEKLLKHIASRGREFERNIEVDYLVKVGAGYQQYFASEKRMPVLWIDNEMGPEALAAYVENLIRRHFSAGMHLNP